MVEKEQNHIQIKLYFSELVILVMEATMCITSIDRIRN